VYCKKIASKRFLVSLSAFLLFTAGAHAYQGERTTLVERSEILGKSARKKVPDGQLFSIALSYAFRPLFAEGGKCDPGKDVRRLIYMDVSVATPNAKKSYTKASYLQDGENCFLLGPVKINTESINFGTKFGPEEYNPLTSVDVDPAIHPALENWTFDPNWTENFGPYSVEISTVAYFRGISRKFDEADQPNYFVGVDQELIDLKTLLNGYPQNLPIAVVLAEPNQANPKRNFAVFVAEKNFKDNRAIKIGQLNVYQRPPN
jgi:hypothetical protein